MALGEIYFVRHGQASFGTADYDRLSELGWQQCRWLGQHFAEAGVTFDRVVAGSLRRHRETAEAILEANVAEGSATVDPGLNELNYDHLHNDADAAGVLPALDMMAEGSFRVTMPLIMAGWEEASFATTHEPFDEFRKRVVNAVEAAATPGARVLVVSSGGPKAIMLRHVLGIDSQTMTRLLLQTMNSSYTRFGLYEDGLHMAEYNAVPHLSVADRVPLRTYI